MAWIHVEGMNVHHAVFGEITYDEDELSWVGRCRLPAFAAWSMQPNGALEQPGEDQRAGFFPLTIYDATGVGPSVQQGNTYRFVQQNEQDTCEAVLLALLDCYRSFYGSNWDWAKQRRDSRIWGWLARRLLQDAYEVPDDLKPVVRCTAMELSYLHVGAYAYAAFRFDTADGLDSEHGIAVVFQPDKGASWGDASAIHHVEAADNVDAE